MSSNLSFYQIMEEYRQAQWADYHRLIQTTKWENLEVRLQIASSQRSILMSAVDDPQVTCVMYARSLVDQQTAEAELLAVINGERTIQELKHRLWCQGRDLVFTGDPDSARAVV